MQEVAISSRLISDVNAELAKAKNPQQSPAHLERNRSPRRTTTLLAKLSYVVTRVQQTETAPERSASESRPHGAVGQPPRASTHRRQPAVGDRSQKTTIDLLNDR